jgi:FtsZ-interacting cell division protein ZipA
MDSFFDILPVLIFIIIPLIRGLNNSKKQKEEYRQQSEKREKKMESPYTPQTSTKNSPKTFKNIRDELEKQVKGYFDLEEEEKNAETKPKSMVSKSNLEKYKRDTEQAIQFMDKKEMRPNYKHVEGISSEWKKEEFDAFKDSPIENVLKTSTKNKNKFLKFSKNPLLQGIIFSEVLGPPKAKKK